MLDVSEQIRVQCFPLEHQLQIELKFIKISSKQKKGPQACHTSQYQQYCIICSTCQSDLHPSTHTHTRTHLPYCERKLVACSLNPMFTEHPVVFCLICCLNWGRKDIISLLIIQGRG